MKRSPLLAVLMFAACSSTTGFVNHTPKSSDFLMSIWRESQATVAAKPICLNPWQQPQEAPSYSKPDSQAYSIEPDGLLVADLPDALPNSESILCDCDGHAGVYVIAYSLFGKATYYAAGYNDNPNLGVVLHYEFDSQILYHLGYDVRWR